MPVRPRGRTDLVHGAYVRARLITYGMGRWMAGRDREFDEFAHAAWPKLHRSAYLLTGDHHLAEDLAQTALERSSEGTLTTRWHRGRASCGRACPGPWPEWSPTTPAVQWSMTTPCATARAASTAKFARSGTSARRASVVQVSEMLPSTRQPEGFNSDTCARVGSTALPASSRRAGQRAGSISVMPAAVVRSKEGRSVAASSSPMVRWTS